MKRLQKLVPLTLLTIVAMAIGVVPASALTTTPDATPWMANGTITASVQYGNVLFVGGDFQRIGASVAPGPNSPEAVTGLTGLGAIDMSTGQAIANFTPQLTANANQHLEVFALSMIGDRLFVGGQFSTVDGESHYNLAAIDINPVTLRGTVVSSFDPTVGTPGAGNESTYDVKVILPAPDGLFVGGAFSKVDGKGRSKIVKLGFDGNVVTSWKAGTIDGSVNDITWSTDQQTLFLVGHFRNLGASTPRVAIGRIDAATAATSPWAVPTSQIPGATSSGQICYEVTVTASRLYAACGKTPNFVGAFRLDNGNEGTRTWQYGTGGNVQTLALISGDQDLVIGGHLGINSGGTYNGRMRCGNSWLRAVAIIRNVASTTSFVSPITSGTSSTTQPWVDCSWLPNIDGMDQPYPQQTQNMPGVNRFGGVWELQVTPTHLWVLGEFEYVNATVRRAIARFPWTGDPIPPPDPVQPVLTELATPSPLMVQPDRTVSFTLRCPDQPAPCNGSAKLVAANNPQFGPELFTLAPLGEVTFTATLDDEAWNKITTKPSRSIGGSIQLTAEGSPGTTTLSSTISVQLRLATP